jgi:hypothetical protein
VDRPRIVIPDAFKRPSGLLVPIGALDVPREGASGPMRISDRVGPGGLSFVQRTPGNVSEHVWQAMPVESDLGLMETSFKELRALVAALPFETATLLYARLAAEFEQAGEDVDRQLSVLVEITDNGPIVEPVSRFLRSHARARVFGPQQFVALLRLCIELASPGEYDPAAYEQFRFTVLRALFASSTVVTYSTSAATKGATDWGRWLAVLVQNGGYHASVAAMNAITREQILLDLAGDPAVGEPVDRVPAHDWMTNDYGLSSRQQLAVGMLALGQTGALESDKPTSDRSILPVGWAAAIAAQCGMEDRTDAIVGLLTADRKWYAEEFAKAPNTVMDVSWRRVPFEVRPFLRRASGEMLLTSPQALMSWLTAGMNHRLIAAAEKRDETQRYRRYRGQLVEQYTLDLMRSALSGADSDRVYGEQTYTVRKSKAKTSDVAVDAGPDLILFEVVSGTLQTRTLLDVDEEAVSKDLQRLVLGKAKQLSNCIDALVSGAAKLNNVDLGRVQRIWPVVVCAGALLQTELLWDHIRTGLGGLLAEPRTQGLTLLDLEDYELLVGLVEHGSAVADILARKASSAYRDGELQLWIRHDPTAPQPAVPTLLTDWYLRIGSDIAAMAGFDGYEPTPPR